MRFDVITLFPDIISAYLNESILKRARLKKLVDVRPLDLRTFSRGRHRKVDDRPFGGGPGMVLQPEPLVRSLDALLKKNSSKKINVVLFSAAGKQFDARMAANWAKKYDRIIMIAGRYEGVDERVKKVCTMEEISVGPYVLMGGELPALIVIDAVSRHVPGVLGANESLEEKRYGPGAAAYTRPELFIWKGTTYKVPPILLSGDHKKIDEWRKSRVRKNK